MQKLKILFLLPFLYAPNVNAYNINGHPATLISCDYTSYGYGERYEVFFGENFCSY